MEVIRAPGFIFHMFQLISPYNMNLMIDLLNYDCIDYFELHFNLTQLFCHSYQRIIPCSVFHNVLNTWVTSYLMSVVDKSPRCKYLEECILGYPGHVTRALAIRFRNRVNECVLHNVYDSYCSHPNNIHTSIEIPVEIVVSSKKEVSSEKNKSKKSEGVTDDKDFQSFLLPLEQDYTKSSKGYNSHVTTIVDKVKKNSCNESEFEGSDDNSIPLSGSFYQTVKSLKSTSSEIESNGKVIQRQLEIEKEIRLKGNCYAEIVHHNSLHSSAGDCNSGSSVMPSENCDAKIAHDYSINFIDDDSDSDVSIVFSENCDAKVAHENSINSINDKSDSDDSIVFSKNCDMKIDHSNSVNFMDDDNSDSDDSIVFSENYGTEIDHDVSINSVDNSDSDDSIVFFKSCNTETGNENSLNYDDDSDTDNSVVFSEDGVDTEQATHLAISIKQFCITPINFDNSESSEDDDDWDKEHEGNDFVPIIENNDFEFGLSDFSGRSSGLQKKLYVSVTQVNTEGYVNACFKDDDVPSELSYIKSINNNWNSEMKDVPNEPHEAKRVSFLPLPDLVSVHSFEPDDDGYSYSLHVLDQMRFRNRISDFETIITPYLTPEHRANIYQQNYSGDK